jgi:hypothetical protein
MIVSKDKFKDSPTLVIKSDENDRWPFSFGPAKAAKLLEAIHEKGMPKMLELMLDVAGDKLDPYIAKELKTQAQKLKTAA